MQYEHFSVIVLDSKYIPCIDKEYYYFVEKIIVLKSFLEL